GWAVTSRRECAPGVSQPSRDRGGVQPAIASSRSRLGALKRTRTHSARVPGVLRQRGFIPGFGGEAMIQRDRRFAGLFLTCGLLLSGCGGPSPVRVTGAVTLDGEPLQGGFVSFESNDPKGGSASCMTNEKGEFKFVPDSP